MTDPLGRCQDIDEIKARFARYGFAIVSDVLSPEALQDFTCAFGWITRDNRRNGKADLGELYDTLAQTPEFLRIASSTAITRIVGEILDTVTIYCADNRCRIDPPHDNRRTYGWHNEVHYALPRSRFVQTWAPLMHPTTAENGTIEVCIGSHVETDPPMTWVEPDGRAPQIIVDQSVVDRYEQVAVEMTPGEVLFFSPTLIHRSGHNRSSMPRYSMVGMYHDTSYPTFRAPKPSRTYRGPTPREEFDRKAA